MIDSTGGRLCSSLPVGAHTFHLHLQEGWWDEKGEDVSDAWGSFLYPELLCGGAIAIQPYKWINSLLDECGLETFSEVYTGLLLEDTDIWARFAAN